MKVIIVELRERNGPYFPPLMNGTYAYNNIFSEPVFSYRDYQELGRFLSQKLIQNI